MILLILGSPLFIHLRAVPDVIPELAGWYLMVERGFLNFIFIDRLIPVAVSEVTIQCPAGLQPSPARKASPDRIPGRPPREMFNFCHCSSLLYVLVYTLYYYYHQKPHFLHNARPKVYLFELINTMD
jgi:hypothetical protein